MKKQDILTELKNFYNNRNVYITGITGFKGPWLALVLKELGANVRGCGLAPDKESMFNEIDLSSKLPVQICNITEPAEKSLYVKDLTDFNPDVVFHLAAQAIVTKGYTNPFDTFNTNIMGTVITHEILRKLNHRVSLINVTTDKVYDESAQPRSETDSLGGVDPYSLSKSCSDRITQCYRQLSPNVVASTMRAGNVIGGGDFGYNRIVPNIIRATRDGGTVELRQANSVRPYQHVFDALIAYIVIAMKQYKDEIDQSEYNVGPIYDPVRTKDLTKMFHSFFDFKYINTGKPIGHENSILMLNPAKIERDADWYPVYSTIQKVVKATALWYDSYLKGKDMYKYSVKEIQSELNKYNQIKEREEL